MTPQNDGKPLIGLKDCEAISVCDLTGVARFIVWAFRWTASEHDDIEFAMECLVESFDGAGFGDVLSAFRSYVARGRTGRLGAAVARPRRDAT